jgi:hypothetical protein
VGLGQVDFVRPYAHKYPPLVFLRFMGMPTESIDEFVQWAADSLAGTPEQQSTAGAKIIAFDTVLNSMSHAWRYLATTPDAQARLAADASQIPNAVEELLRFNVITNNSRRVREDMDFAASRKKGDPVLLLGAPNLARAGLAWSEAVAPRGLSPRLTRPRARCCGHPPVQLNSLSTMPLTQLPGVARSAGPRPSSASPKFGAYRLT